MISRVRRSLARDDGFTLIELVVSLAIAMVIFSAMAAAAIAGVRASVVARQNQQAVDVLNRIVEDGRGYEFTNLAMVTSDLSSDSAITGTATKKYTVPNGIGAEPVWAGSTGSINPHVTTETGTNGLQYTVKRYITVPNGVTYDSQGVPYEKRYTVVATWSSYGSSHTRVVSTLITETQRGLPLPRYSVATTSSTTATKNPSTTLTWGFQVINRGARDAFNISASTGTWTYYVDANCNGGLDAGETTQLSNSDAATGDTSPDTGQLEPNNYPPFCVLASRSIPSTELGVSSVKFILTSSAQPAASGAVVNSATYTVTVQSGAVGGSSSGTPSTSDCLPSPALAAQGTGTTLTSMGLRNGAPTAGATTSQILNSFTQGSCAPQSQDYNFSTDVSDGVTVGRALLAGGSATSTTATQMAEWRYNPASDTTFNGTASASLAVKCPSSTGTVTLNVALGTYTAKTSTWASQSAATKSITCSSTTAWTQVEVALPIATSFVVKNKSQGQPQYLSLRMWTATGSAGLRVNYESPNNKSFLTVSMG